MEPSSANGAATWSGPRICPLCEACCGLLFELDGQAVTAVAANADDVLSAGHSCAKGLGLALVEADPDRIRTPLIRTATGGFRTATWEEAFAEIDRRLPRYVIDNPGTCAGMA